MALQQWPACGGKLHLPRDRTAHFATWGAHIFSGRKPQRCRAEGSGRAYSTGEARASVSGRSGQSRTTRRIDVLKLLSHYNVRTRKAAETRDFYVDVLGLREGDRPEFPFPGHWMYCGEMDVLHIVGIVDDDAGLKDYLGDRGAEADLQGGGAIDHIAFTATDAVAMAKHFVKHDIAARHRRVPNMDLYQIFLEDPNGITIELNFPGENPPADIPGA